jgi:hypothetical protein
MLLRICISLLLTLTLSYLVLQVHTGFVSGMNPYAGLFFLLVPIALIIINFFVARRVTLTPVRTALYLAMILGIAVPILFIYFKQPEINSQNTPRRYIDYSDPHR